MRTITWTVLSFCFTTFTLSPNLKQGVNFSLHNETEQVAYEYACKHLESIQSMIKKLPDEVPSEKLINEKFGDAINYLIIIEGLLKERLKK